MCLCANIFLFSTNNLFHAGNTSAALSEILFCQSIDLRPNMCHEFSGKAYLNSSLQIFAMSQL